MIHQDRALIRDGDRSSVVPHRGLVVLGSHREPGTHAGANDAWPTNNTSTTPPCQTGYNTGPHNPVPLTYSSVTQEFFRFRLWYRHIQVVSILTTGFVNYNKSGVRDISVSVYKQRLYFQFLIYKITYLSRYLYN